MLVAVAAVTSFAPMSSGPAALHGARATAPVMAADRKIFAMDNDIVFEAREVSVARKPVALLKTIEDLKVATAVSEAGLLSKAEEAGLFSTLEGLGAFSTAEKLLPTIEGLGLLSLFEDLLEVEAGLIFTAANFLLVLPIVIFTLQICSFVPIPAGPAIGVELVFDAALVAGGAALFATAFIISKLQLQADKA